MRLTLDEGRPFEVTVDGATYRVRPREWTMLLLLAQHPGKVCPTDVIWDALTDPVRGLCYQGIVTATKYRLSGNIPVELAAAIQTVYGHGLMLNLRDNEVDIIPAPEWRRPRGGVRP